MLNFIKKIEHPKTEPVGLDGAGQVFETGKQVTFQDPKTGEFVYQMALTPEQRKSVMDTMTKNANLANKFIQASRQRIAIEEQVSQVHKEIIASEKEIQDAITKVRDEHKLDKRWGLNMQLGLLERREPPNG